MRSSWPTLSDNSRPLKNSRSPCHRNNGWSSVHFVYSLVLFCQVGGLLSAVSDHENGITWSSVRLVRFLTRTTYYGKGSRVRPINDHVISDHVMCTCAYMALYGAEIASFPQLLSAVPSSSFQHPRQQRQRHLPKLANWRQSKERLTLVQRFRHRQIVCASFWESSISLCPHAVHRSRSSLSVHCSNHDDGFRRPDGGELQ